MSRVSIKKIKKQADIWRQDAIMAPAAYRLFVYLEVEHIPEDIVKFMGNKEMLETWNEQISFDGIEADIDLTIKNILNSLHKRKQMEAFMYVPILLADLFVLDKGVSRLEGNYRKMINNFADMAVYDRPVAEIDAMFNLADLMLEVAKKINLKLDYDIKELVTQFIEEQDLINQGAGDKVVDLSIEQAIKEYEELTGKGLFDGIEEGIDTEALQKEIDELKKELTDNNAEANTKPN